MSKMDNLRAMREARFERASAQPRKKAPAASRPPVRPPEEPAADAASTPDEPSGDGLCGHRNIGGRSCTREKGHAAKSHRYS